MTAFDSDGSEVSIFFDGDQPKPGAIGIALSDENEDGVAMLTVKEAHVVLGDLVDAINLRAADASDESEVVVIQIVNRKAWEALRSTT